MSFKVTSIKLEGTVGGDDVIMTLKRIPGEPKRVTSDFRNMADPRIGYGKGKVIDPDRMDHRYEMVDHLVELFGCDPQSMEAAHLMELVEFVCK